MELKKYKVKNLVIILLIYYHNNNNNDIMIKLIKLLCSFKFHQHKAEKRKHKMPIW